MIMQHTEQEIIEHCAKLLWGFNWAQSNFYGENIERLDVGLQTYCMPKGLTDEDKFLCAIFIVNNIKIFLTPELLGRLYGWDEYKSKEVKKNIPFVEKRACVCDNGYHGYHGKGWTISSKLEENIILLQEQNKMCFGCALLSKSYVGEIYECPINHEYFSYPTYTHCDKIKLEVTEQFNNFWK